MGANWPHDLVREANVGLESDPFFVHVGLHDEIELRWMAPGACYVFEVIAFGLLMPCQTRIALYAFLQIELREPATNALSLLHQQLANEEALDELTSNISLVDMNYVLYRCEREEEERSYQARLALCIF